MNQTQRKTVHPHVSRESISIRPATRIEVSQDGNVKISGNVSQEESYFLAQQALDNANLLARQNANKPQPIVINISCSDGAMGVLAVCTIAVMLLLMLGDIVKSRQPVYNSVQYSSQKY